MNTICVKEESKKKSFNGAIFLLVWVFLFSIEDFSICRLRSSLIESNKVIKKRRKVEKPNTRQVQSKSEKIVNKLASHICQRLSKKVQIDFY